MKNGPTKEYKLVPQILLKSTWVAAVLNASSPCDRGRARLAGIHGAHQGGRVEVRSAASLCLR